VSTFTEAFAEAMAGGGAASSAPDDTASSGGFMNLMKGLFGR
jgi:hypothetical protein